MDNVDPFFPTQVFVLKKARIYDDADIKSYAAVRTGLDRAMSQKSVHEGLCCFIRKA